MEERTLPEASLIYENTLPAVFIKRLNRFSARVLIEGREETVHVKNTGRLGELLVQGAPVTLQRAGNPARKTAYDLISVYREGLSWVNIDSLAPNVLVRRYLESSLQYDLVRPEYTYGASRFDFYMEKGQERYLHEVKGCTLAPEPLSGTGYFPDAPTDRGIRHLKELAGAAALGWRCALDFVIQMNGIDRVEPNDRTQPAFGRALREAEEAGVQVFYFCCRVEADRIRVRKVIKKE